jgi:cell division protein FtsQ
MTATKWIIIGALAVVAFTVIAFSNSREAGMSDLHIQIESSEGNFFISENEVRDLLIGEENILSLPVSKWDMSAMERRVEANPFVYDCQVFRDVRGNVIVKVVQRKPLARVFSRSGHHKYIDHEGNLLPTKAGHTARVPVVEIYGLKWENSLTETEYGRNLHTMLKYVSENKFWRAQLAHFIVRSNGNIEIIPQVTRQRVLFGTPEDVDSKLERLMIFYKDILPAKGWNEYTTVNLKYKNQIICE